MTKNNAANNANQSRNNSAAATNPQPPPRPPLRLHRREVGGPLLGSRQPPLTCLPSKNAGTSSALPVSVPSAFLDSWTTLPPLLTESLVLLPRETSVDVLSATTSRPLGRLILPAIDDAEFERKEALTTDDTEPPKAAADATDAKPVEEGSAASTALAGGRTTNIETATVFQGHAWVGLADGRLLEYTLDDETWGSRPPTGRQVRHRPPQQKLQDVLPRRVLILPESRLRLTRGAVDTRLLHLALVEADTGAAALAYVLLACPEYPEDSSQNTKKKSATAIANLSLLRFSVPAWNGAEGVTAEGAPTTAMQTLTLAESDLNVVDEWEYPLAEAAQRHPFDLLAARSTLRLRSSTVMVLVATPAALTVYKDDSFDPPAQAAPKPPTPKVALHHPQHRPKKPPHPLSAAALSTDCDTVALGYWNGEVLVWPHLLSHVQMYMGKVEQYWANRKARPPQTAEEEADIKARKPQHPLNGLPSQRLHWHAHPVRTLAFGDARRLYSGGEESVLVVWELDRADPKTEVLPRLGLGALVHVALPRRRSGEVLASSLLVHCGDNSLQLLLAHNLARVWKQDGLAAVPVDLSAEPLATHVPLWADPDAATLWLTGLPRAPGKLQGWDAARHRVRDASVVVPYNRVSRVDWDDPPLPEPRVILACADARSTMLVTVDYVPTENSGIGHSLDPDEGGVTTLRFWRRRVSQSSAERPPFEPVAAIAFPHGATHDVAALAVSPCGRYACTVSNTERSWRLWSRRGGDDDDDNPTGGGPEWACHYRVDLPAGYSNYRVASRGADFSSDSTVLAMAHGPYIALWDFADNARLVGTQTHFDVPSKANPSSPLPQHSRIESLQFISNADMILTVAKGSVKLQSPYGWRGPRGWTYQPGRENAAGTVATAAPVENFVAVALHRGLGTTEPSQVVLLDWWTGAPLTAIQHPAEKILSMASFPAHHAGWSDVRENDPSKPLLPSIRLFILDSLGVLSLVEAASEKVSPMTPILIQDELPYLESLVPKVALLSELPQRRAAKKRRMAVLDEDNLESAVQDESSANAVAALLSAPSLDDAPHLGTAFVRAFVTRHLKG